MYNYNTYIRPDSKASRFTSITPKQILVHLVYKCLRGGKWAF